MSELQKARNPALVVMPDPTPKCGECKEKVASAVKKFDEGDEKDGLGDVCETANFAASCNQVLEVVEFALSRVTRKISWALAPVGVRFPLPALSFPALGHSKENAQSAFTLEQWISGTIE